MSDPIFKAVFGKEWNHLPLVFRKHYANHPYSNDINTVEGLMDISYSRLMACFIPVNKLLKILVPYRGKKIPVTVDYVSKTDSAEFCLYRTFYFPGKKPYAFNSQMKVEQNDSVVELMRFGLGWRMRYFYDGKKVILQHKRFVWKMLGICIPLPLEIFIGKGHAEEEMIDENSYRVTMTLTHALFGEMYRYEGDFTFKRITS